MSEPTRRYGLLLAMMQQGIIPETEIDEWYDQEHIPERRATSGFITGQRFMNVTPAPRYLALYDLESIDVFQSPGYEALRANLSGDTRRILADAVSFRRGFYEQRAPGRLSAPADAGGVLLVEFDCQPSDADAVRAWCDQEYLPRCAAINGVLTARRFQALDDNPKYLALFHLVSPAVADQGVWDAALDPWRPNLLNVARSVYRAPHRA